MDFIRLVADAGAYTQNAFTRKRARWPVFIISKYLVYPLFLGYIVEIYRGKMPSASDDPYEFIQDEPHWFSLFLNGIRLLIIKILYTMPIIVTLGPILITFFFGDGDALTTMASDVYGIPEAVLITMGMLVGLFIFLYTFIIGINLPIGLIRFSRTGSMREAFRFGAIIGDIGKIGRLRYIFSTLFIITGLEPLSMRWHRCRSSAGF